MFFGLPLQESEHYTRPRLKYALSCQVKSVPMALGSYKCTNVVMRLSGAYCKTLYFCMPFICVSFAVEDEITNLKWHSSRGTYCFLKHPNIPIINEFVTF
jgi:hypothetical protein